MRYLYLVFIFMSVSVSINATTGILDRGGLGNDAFTVLLVQSDTNDESTTFTDTSRGGTLHTVSAQGNINHEVDQKKFGSTSIQSDGTTDYLTIPDSDDWYMGGGDWTIDMWARFNVLDVQQNFYSQWVDTAGGHINFYWDATNGPTIVMGRPGGAKYLNYLNPGSVAGWSTNTWYHIALVVNNGTCNIYRDGVSLVSGATSGDYPQIATNIGLGALSHSGANSLNGYADEIRITKGLARWIKDFTPPNRMN